ncbi:NAD(P)H-binding protein [Streptomyces sp. NPDC048639]|uniref:NAD(P)H-binding protein n=1 Tax=Streptomyces sp. NPDC048639 TaxID=3365581 RepID=UPI003710DAD5
MRVVIAGGHGQIALRLGRLLSGRGDAAVGLIRNAAHAADLREAGVEPVLCDLETATPGELAAHLRGTDPAHRADAVVFAAGAGPGSGARRKDTVDRAAAVLLADAAVQAGVRRYVMVSTRGAGSEPRPGLDETGVAYVRAKTAADAYVMSQDLDWTILRPAALTNAPATGTVRLTAERGPGDVTRDDTASALLALLDTPSTRGLTLELAQGETPLAEAVSACARDRTGARQE